MKITKYLHSCLLVEDQGITTLIDPGEFTIREKVLQIDAIQALDYLLITHEHSDHMNLDIIKELVKRLLAVKILTTESAQTLLTKSNISSFTSGDAFIELENAPHEKLFDKTAPENMVFHVANKLTHPGDSLQFTKTADILALPITAPWGSTTEMVQKALELKPKVIIPIHDYLWKDEIRKGMYARLTEFFLQYGIAFHGIETGETIEV